MFFIFLWTHVLLQSLDGWKPRRLHLRAVDSSNSEMGRFLTPVRMDKSLAPFCWDTGLVQMIGSHGWFVLNFLQMSGNKPWLRRHAQKSLSQSAVQSSNALCSLFLFSATVETSLASTLSDTWRGCNHLSTDFQCEVVQGFLRKATVSRLHWKPVGFPCSKSTLHHKHPLLGCATLPVQVGNTRRAVRRVLTEKRYHWLALKPGAPLRQIFDKIHGRNS